MGVVLGGHRHVLTANIAAAPELTLQPILVAVWRCPPPTGRRPTSPPGGVPTVSDEYGDAYDFVDHAARLVSRAQDVLIRAVVYARERDGRWDDIAEALNLTAEQARDHYTAAIEQWEDALNRPWERSGRFLASRMPDGTTELDETAVDLDQWCLRHLEENSDARHNARYDGIEDRMFSANLPSTRRSRR